MHLRNSRSAKRRGQLAACLQPALEPQSIGCLEHTIGKQMQACTACKTQLQALIESGTVVKGRQQYQGKLGAGRRVAEPRLKENVGLLRCMGEDFLVGAGGPNANILPRRRLDADL